MRCGLGGGTEQVIEKFLRFWAVRRKEIVYVGQYTVSRHGLGVLFSGAAQGRRGSKVMARKP